MKEIGEEDKSIPKVLHRHLLLVFLMFLFCTTCWWLQILLMYSRKSRAPLSRRIVAINVKVKIFVYLTSVIFYTYNGNRMIKEWPFGMKGFSFNLHKYCYNWFTALLFRFLFTRLGILTLAGDLWWNGKQNLYFAVGLFFFFFFNAV